MKIKHFLAAVATAAMVLTPATAVAQTRERSPEREEYSLDRVKARCLEQIRRRQSALDNERERLRNARALTDEHRRALMAINEEVANGLAALADEIQAEDNAEELRVLCRRIVEDFRVFTLVRPRARLVVASDRALAGVERLRNVASRIEDAIERAQEDGRDTAEAERHLAAMRTAIDAAAEQAGGVFDDVIGLTAADYNANNDVLEPSVAAVRAARDSMQTAVSEGRAARQSLRSDA
jgi:hypothetical protein